MSPTGAIANMVYLSHVNLGCSGISDCPSLAVAKLTGILTFPLRKYRNIQTGSIYYPISKCDQYKKLLRKVWEALQEAI